MHDDGLRHTPGFQYDAATASAMRSVDLAKIPADRPLADRVLLLSRTDRPAPESIEKRVRLEPGQVEVGPATAQDQLLDRTPSDCYVPEEALAAVVDWLVAGSDEVRVPVKAPEERSVRLSSAAPGSPLVRERPMRIGPLGLYGVVDEPRHAHPRAVGGPGQRRRRAPHRTRPTLGRVGPAAGPATATGSSGSTRAASVTAPSTRGRSRTRCSPPSGSATCARSCRPCPRTAPRWSWSVCAPAPTRRSRSRCGRRSRRSSRSTRGSPSSRRRRAPTSTPRSAERASCRPGRSRRWPSGSRILAGGIWRIYRQVAVWHGPFRVLRSVVKRGTAVHVSACRDDGQHFTEVLFWRPFLARLRRNPRFTVRAGRGLRPLAAEPAPASWPPSSAPRSSWRRTPPCPPRTRT